MMDKSKVLNIEVEVNLRAGVEIGFQDMVPKNEQSIEGREWSR